MTLPGQEQAIPPYAPQIAYLPAPTKGRPGQMTDDMGDEFRVVQSLLSNILIPFGAFVVYDPTQTLPIKTSAQDLSLMVPCTLPSTALQITGASAVQTITPSAVPASGTVVFNFDGVASAAINWNDTASQIQTKLQAMANIGTGNITVAGTFATTVVLTFAGALALVAQNAFIFTSNTLEDGGSAPVTLVNATTTAGVPSLGLGIATLNLHMESGYDANPPGYPATLAISSNARGAIFVQTEQQNTARTTSVYVRYTASAAASEVQKLNFQLPYGTVVAADAGSIFTLSFLNQTTQPIKLTGTAGTDAAAIQTALNALASIGSGNVAVASDSANGFNITFQGALANLPQSFVQVLYASVFSGGLPALTIVAQSTQGTPGYPVGSISNASDAGKNALIPAKNLPKLGVSMFNPFTLQWITSLEVNMIK